jgi:hypothetical protein
VIIPPISQNSFQLREKNCDDMSNEGSPYRLLTACGETCHHISSAPLLCAKLPPKLGTAQNAQVPWRAREGVARLLSLPPPREGNGSRVLRELRLFAHFLPGCDEGARPRPGLVYSLTGGTSHCEHPPCTSSNTSLCEMTLRRPSFDIGVYTARPEGSVCGYLSYYITEGVVLPTRCS